MLPSNRVAELGTSVLAHPPPAAVVILNAKLTVHSSKGSTVSTHTQNTGDSGKSMHAISKAVSQNESRVQTWKNGSRFDEPYVVGGHGGRRVWHLNNKMINFDQRYQS
jgi:hypothetical protein